MTAIAPVFRSHSCAIRLLTACLLLPAFRSAAAQPVAPAPSNSGGIDVHVADIFIRSVFTDHRADQYDKAAQLYLDVLAAAATPLDSADQAILYRYLAQLAPILPPKLRVRLRTNDDSTSAPQGRTLSQESAEALVAWWRSQDPLIATERNERLVEHLERVAVAEKRFADDSAPAGFDARGTLYVRLGQPDQTVRLGIAFGLVPWDKLTDDMSQQYWIYRRMGRYARYILVRNEARFEIGSFQDLLPLHLRHGIFAIPASRFAKNAGEQNAIDYLRAVKKYSDQLSRFDAEHRTYPSGVGPPSQSPKRGSAAYLASAVLSPLIMRQEYYMDQQRSQTVPPAWSAVARDAGPLAVSARLARFLDADGTTRTELYWAPTPGALAPTASEQTWLSLQHYSLSSFLLRTSLVQYTADFSRSHSNNAQLLVTGAALQPQGTIPTQTALSPGDSLPFSLALDVEQNSVSSGTGEHVEAGPPLRRTVLRFDSLQALSSDQFEVSDLRPMLIPRSIDLASLQAGSTEAMRQVAYPFEKVRPDAHLGLYFEVYGLTRDAGGKTRYTVGVEVYRKADTGVLMRLLKGDRSQETASVSISEGTRDRVGRLLLVDLRDYDLKPGRLVLTVTVRDEVSGAEKVRSLSFQVM